jgi:hypothetical protein
MFATTLCEYQQVKKGWNWLGCVMRAPTLVGLYVCITESLNERLFEQDKI